MTILALFGAAATHGATLASSAAGTRSPTIAIVAAAAWVLTLVLIAVAVRANWGIARHMPPWAVTATLIAIGALVVVAFVARPAWVGITALIAVFATWLWFLARWLFPRLPEVQEYIDRSTDPQLAAEQDAERAVSVQRGAALDEVLDEAVREEHPEA